MSRTRSAWFVTIVIVAAGLATQSAAAQKASATLRVLDQKVSVAKKASPDEFRSAKSGARIAAGDTMRTNGTGFAELEFADGSLTRVDVDTTVTINALGANEAVSTELSEGQVWSEVEAATGGETRYEVDTPNATAVVRGTAFATSCDDERCTFAVVDGTVEVTAGATTVPVGAGQQVDVDAAGTIGPIVPLEVSGWIQQNQAQDQADGREPPGGFAGNTGSAQGTSPAALERALQRDYNAFQADRVGAPFDAVTCRGQGKLSPGDSTTCVGTAGGKTLDVRVTVLDADGSYAWSRQASLIDVSRYEAVIRGTPTDDGTPLVEVKCSGARIQYVVIPGGGFTCQLTDAVGRTGEIAPTMNRAGALVFPHATLR